MNKLTAPLRVVDGSSVARGRTNQMSYSMALAFIAGFWFIPTLMTVMEMDSARVSLVTILVGAMTCIAIIWRPFYMLLGIPFFALISPAGGFIEFLGVKAVLTDWVLSVIALQALYLGVSSAHVSRVRVRKNSAGYFLFPLTVVFLLSYLFNFLLGNINSAGALYYLLCFALIGFYFTRYARTENEWQAILWAWMLAALCGSFILIHAFIAGEPLINFAKDDEFVINRESIQGIFRASYYYAGYHFIAGILVVGVLLRLVFVRDRVLKKLGMGVLFGCLLLALFAMLNKTAMFSALLSFAVVYIVVGMRLGSLNIVSLSVFAVGCVSAMGWLLLQYGGDLYQGVDQMTASVTSVDSFLIRTQIWINALQVLFNQPVQAIIGFGPNFIETSSQDLAELFAAAADSGAPEGALDSSWLTYFIELGVVGFLLLGAFFLKAISIMKRCLREMPSATITHPTFLAVAGGLVYLLFSLFTQSLGYAKISWLPFQLLLIAFAYFPALRGRRREVR